jgi:hypothetical protein
MKDDIISGITIINQECKLSVLAYKPLKNWWADIQCNNRHQAMSAIKAVNIITSVP